MSGLTTPRPRPPSAAAARTARPACRRASAAPRARRLEGGWPGVVTTVRAMLWDAMGEQGCLRRSGRCCGMGAMGEQGCSRRSGRCCGMGAMVKRYYYSPIMPGGPPSSKSMSSTASITCVHDERAFVLAYSCSRDYPQGLQL